MSEEVCFFLNFTTKNSSFGIASEILNRVSLDLPNIPIIVCSNTKISHPSITLNLITSNEQNSLLYLNFMCKQFPHMSVLYFNAYEYDLNDTYQGIDYGALKFNMDVLFNMECVSLLPYVDVVCSEYSEKYTVWRENTLLLNCFWARADYVSEIDVSLINPTSFILKNDPCLIWLHEQTFNPASYLGYKQHEYKKTVSWNIKNYLDLLPRLSLSSVDMDGENIFNAVALGDYISIPGTKLGRQLLSQNPTSCNVTIEKIFFPVGKSVKLRLYPKKKIYKDKCNLCMVTLKINMHSEDKTEDLINLDTRLKNLGVSPYYFSFGRSFNKGKTQQLEIHNYSKECTGAEIVKMMEIKYCLDPEGMIYYYNGTDMILPEDMEQLKSFNRKRQAF